MYLEPIIHSEVSQKEKAKYCVLTHAYEIISTIFLDFHIDVLIDDVCLSLSDLLHCV